MMRKTRELNIALVTFSGHLLHRSYFWQCLCSELCLKILLLWYPMHVSYVVIITGKR